MIPSALAYEWRAPCPLRFPLDVSTLLSNSSTSLIRTSSSHYRETNFDPHPEDRPLIVQFCGHDPALLLASAKYVEKDCDAVDLNLVSPARVTSISMQWFTRADSHARPYCSLLFPTAASSSYLRVFC